MAKEKENCWENCSDDGLIVSLVEINVMLENSIVGVIGSSELNKLDPPHDKYDVKSALVFEVETDLQLHQFMSMHNRVVEVLKTRCNVSNVDNKIKDFPDGIISQYNKMTLKPIILKKEN